MYHSILVTRLAVCAALILSSNVFAASAPAPDNLPSTSRGEIDRWPIAIGRHFYTPNPPYPAAARQKRSGAAMMLRVLFDAKGDVEKIAVLKARGDRSLISHTIVWATKNWKMTPKPGFQGGYKDVPIGYKYSRLGVRI